MRPMKTLALLLSGSLLATSLSMSAGAGAALAAGAPAPTSDTSPPAKPAAGAAVAQPPGPVVGGKPAPAIPTPQTDLPATPAEDPIPASVSSVPLPPKTGDDYDPATSVEQVDQRTSDGKVYRNANGTFTTLAFSGPIHFRNALGAWQEIDRHLVLGSDGAFHPRANGVDVALASNANSAQLATVTVDPLHSVTYRLDGAASAKGVVDGATVTYRNARPSTDVELIALSEGVKETLILTARSAPTSFTFPLTLRGLRASIADNGDVVYTDLHGVERARTPHGSMIDSAVDAGSGEGVKSYGVKYTLVPWGTGKALRMTLDATWLADPARRFPVMVDPTTVTKLTESDDTYVQSGFTANNSLETELKIGTPNTVPNTTYTYTHFNTIGSTYDDYYVSSAWLKMYEVHSWTCDPRTWRVYTVNASWSGSTVTHPGASYDSTAVTSVTSAKGDTCGGPSWNSRIDVRSAVQSWNHGKPNHGLTLRPGSTTDRTYWKRFASYQADPINHSSAPRIEFTYSPQGARYAPSYAFNVNPTNTVNGKTKVAVRNYGKYTWPANGVYKLGYHLYDGAGTFIKDGIRTAMPQDVSPNELITIDATVGKLAPGDYIVVFDMVQDGVTWFSDVGVDVPAGMAFTITNQKPIITSVNSPADMAAVTTTRPALSVTGSDTDAYPATGALQYSFKICTDAAMTTGCISSAYSTASTWTPPANTLYWRKTYYWHAYVKDAGGAIQTPNWAWSFTPVVADASADAHFGADPYGISDGGVNVSVGNFVTSAVDAPVATVGPAMSVSRTYNSQDTKVGRFGVGWTSLYDMTATADAIGNVNVVHADGRKALYGKNPNGTYAAAYGYYSTLKAVTGGGWTLTDKNATTYTFDSAGRLTSIKDRSGKTVTLVDTAPGVTTATDVTSGRTVTLTRNTTDNLVSHVRTDTLSAFGKPMEWRYFYNASKQLTQVCDPRNPVDGGSCTKYDYLGVGGRMSKLTMPRGNSPVQIAYAEDGTVRTRTDGEGKTWTYQLAMLEATEAGTERTQRVTDPNLNFVEYVYNDTTSRLLRRRDAAGKTRTFRYDTTTGYLAGITDENLNTLTLKVDDRGNILTRSVPYGTGVATSYYTYFYGAEGVDDPRDNKLLTYRDARSTSATDDRYLTTYEYAATTGALSSVTPPCPAGFVSPCPKQTWTYTTGAEAAVGSTGTQPIGLLLTETDARQKSTTYSYNSKGDLTRIVAPSGLRTDYSYDELGRQVTTTTFPSAHPDGLTTTTTYTIGGMVGQVDEPAVADAATGLTHRKRTTYMPDANGIVRDIVESDLTGPDATRTTHMDVDNNDRTTLIRDPEGAVTTRTYDPIGNLDVVTDPRGQRLDYDYDANDRLVTVTARGVVDNPIEPSAPRDVVLQRRTYDAAGRLDKVTDARGVVRDHEWYADDRLASVTVLGYRNVDGTTRDVVTEWHGYDPAGNETTTKLGGYLRTITRVFDNAGWVTSETLDAATVNRVTTFGRDAAGNVTRHTLTDATGRTEETRTEYDDAGLPTKQIVENGATDLVTTMERDDRGLVTKVRDPRGNAVVPVDTAFETSIVYNAAGQPTAVTGARLTAESPGQTPATTRPVTKFGYDTFGNQVRMVDPRGNAHSAIYDKANRATERAWPSYTPPGGTSMTPVEKLTYSSAGDVLTFTDRRGNTTTFDYDSRGRMIRRTEPKPDASSGNPVSWTRYDDAGGIVGTTDPSGAVREVGYDDLGRVRTQTDVVRNGTGTPDRFTSILDYDDLSNMNKEVAPRGGTAYGSYNAASELIQYQDPSGALWKLRRDVAGRVTRTTDPLNRYEETTFDQAGRATTLATHSPTGALLRTQNAGYDAAGNVTSYTPVASGPGVTTAATRTFAWSAMNLLTAMTEPSSATVSATTSFGYDVGGNRTRITDGNGNATTTTYNTWNMPEAVLEPSTALYPEVGNRQYVTVYDAGGLPTESRAPGSVSVQRTFDGLGRVTSELGVGATGSKQFGYDLLGRITAASHPNGTQTFTYDDRGLVTGSAGPAGASSYLYDANGWMSSKTDAVGTTSVTWDARGLPSTITDPITTRTQTLTYKPDWQIESRQYGTPGPKRTYSYDDFGRLATDTVTSPAGTTTASLAYQYDPSGNVTRITRGGSLATTGGNTYAYDLADRLTSWTAPDGAVTPYEYDKAGNRTRAGSTTYTYNERNWLLSDSAGSSYTYTRRGTMRSSTAGSTTINYTFDAFDRMTGDGATTNTYDALDRLATAGAAGFSYAGLDREPILAGATKAARGPAGDLLAIGAGVLSTAVMSNQHGDVEALVSAVDGSVSGSTSYDPFGTVTARTGSHTPFGYQGQFTAATGRVHMQARWYTPGTATFASRDTLAMSAPRAAGANRYAYGIGNPVTNADPSGHGLACGNQVDCDFVAPPLAPPAPILPPKPVSAPKPATPPGGGGAGAGSWLLRGGVIGAATLGFLIGPLADPAGDPYSCYDVNCGAMFGYEVDWDKVGHGTMRITVTYGDALDGARHGAPKVTVTIKDKDGKILKKKIIFPPPDNYWFAGPPPLYGLEIDPIDAVQGKVGAQMATQPDSTTPVTGAVADEGKSCGAGGTVASCTPRERASAPDGCSVLASGAMQGCDPVDTAGNGNRGGNGNGTTTRTGSAGCNDVGGLLDPDCAPQSTMQDYLDIVEALDVSTGPNQAVFYSGPGQRTLAEAFAQQNGKLTLEMTNGGRWLDAQRLFESGSLTKAEAVQVWSRLSERFASAASGNATGFVNGARATGIFNTVEYPTLMANPNVTNVITGGL